MATPTLQGSNTASESIIAGYFTNGEDAHRAINALLDEGFLASQIGAAFHTGGGSQGAPAQSTSGRDTGREALGTTITPTSGSDVSNGGPYSDTTAVQPVGLATGTGSPILGAGKPGAISGSDLSNTGLPTELHSELPHSQPGTAISHTPSHVSSPSHHLHENDSWGSKLKHLFSSKAESTGSTAVGEDSQNFGTGQGQLSIAPHGHAYSRPAFEQSVSSFGVEREHSRHLAHRLSTGGAVVTVSATGRAVEVEKIFERHHGHVRFASGGLDEVPVSGTDSRVEVFGHLEHIYPGSSR